MANTIQKFKKYVVGLLDEVYKNASKTAILDGAPELASQGANADELIIPKIDMDGLGDYDRNSGYTQGEVQLRPRQNVHRGQRGQHGHRRHGLRPSLR